MEKWALKLGLSGEQVKYNQALHWLTSAKGEDPALIGLTRVEGGGPPKLGAAELSLEQGCPKSIADGEVQNPSIIGLKSWKLPNMRRYTVPKVAPTEVVQRSIEPVGEARCEGD